MQTNCDIATIALAQAEAEERAEDRGFLALNSQLDAKQLEVDVVGKLLYGCNDTEEIQEPREELKKLQNEIRGINVELAKWTSSLRAPNKLVDNLLSNAETMMASKVMRRLRMTMEKLRFSWVSLGIILFVACYHRIVHRS
jgi:hypothetical protein